MYNRGGVLIARAPSMSQAVKEFQSRMTPMRESAD